LWFTASWHHLALADSPGGDRDREAMAQPNQATNTFFPPADLVLLRFDSTSRDCRDWKFNRQQPDCGDCDQTSLILGGIMFFYNFGRRLVSNERRITSFARRPPSRGD